MTDLHWLGCVAWGAVFCAGCSGTPGQGSQEPTPSPAGGSAASNADPDGDGVTVLAATGGSENLEWLAPGEVFFLQRTHEDDTFQMPVPDNGDRAFFVIADGHDILFDDLPRGRDLTDDENLEQSIADYPRMFDVLVVRRVEQITPELVDTLEALASDTASLVLIGTFDQGIDLGLLARGRLAEAVVGLHLGFQDEVDVSGLTAFENLEAVSLQGYSVTGFSTLMGHPPLRSLSLELDQLSDDDLDRLGAAGSLRRLLFGGYPLDERALERIGRMTGLRHLSLQRAQLEDESLAHLAALRDLRTLDLDRTGIGDAGLAHLAGLTQLRVLSLTDTGVADAGLRHLAGMRELRALTLALTDTTDDGLALLSDLRRLEYLNLNQTLVTEAGLARLEPLTQLRYLDLTGTEVPSESLNRFLARHPDCRTLDY